MRLLTLEDFDTKGKTVFLRVDMNSPIDPKTMEILETSRIRESTESLKDLEEAKVVIASHQGRVGNKDYT
ncbi:MAG: phosphoglycerate kinase, partial [Nitrosopumilaceae archaeon]